MKLEEFFERFVFIRHCAGCGELLEYERREDAFCAECRMSFEAAKSASCPICSKAMVECECMPKKLSSSGLPTLKKLFLYKSAKVNLPQNRMLYFIKHNKNHRIAKFIAAQLDLRLRELFRDNDISADDVVITYIPRTKSAVCRYGFDQCELICRELSKLSSAELLPLFSRCSEGREQKRLSSVERADNARKDLSLNEDALALLSGRTVILFDDIVTSGASMSQAVKLLRHSGVRDILGLCVAMTE